MNILEEIAKTSHFEMDIFNGLVKIQGRILSPAEVESAGLASAMIASEVFKNKNKAQFEYAQKMAKKIKDGDQDQESILSLLQTVKPETLERLAKREEEIVKKTVIRCSKDNGATWEPLILVDAVDQQDAKRNRLWVGMIYPEDRKSIVERALNGHREASEKLESFRK